MKRRMGWILAFLLLTLTLVPALAQGVESDAVLWIESQVGEDGGVGDGFSEGSSPAATADAVLAAAAAGIDSSTWGEGTSPLDYLASQASTLETTGGQAKLALAALSTGLDTTDFGGVDLIEQITASYDADSGVFAGTVTDHALAMLALHAAGEAVPGASAEALKALQDEEGGWSFDGTSQADTNTTGIALQALAAADEPGDGESVSAALDYLRGQQNEDGGFPYQNPSDFGTESDANSTAQVVQGLLASGQSLDDWNDPLTFLSALQLEEGALQWKSDVPDANFLATVQAVPALAEATLVEPPIVEAANPPRAQDDATDETGGDDAGTEENEAADEADSSEDEPESLPDSGGQPTWPYAAVGVGSLLLIEGLRRRRAA